MKMANHWWVTVQEFLPLESGRENPLLVTILNEDGSRSWRDGYYDDGSMTFRAAFADAGTQLKGVIAWTYVDTYCDPVEIRAEYHKAYQKELAEHKKRADRTREQIRQEEQKRRATLENMAARRTHE